MKLTQTLFVVAFALFSAIHVTAEFDHAVHDPLSGDTPGGSVIVSGNPIPPPTIDYEAVTAGESTIMEEAAPALPEENMQEAAPALPEEFTMVAP